MPSKLLTIIFSLTSLILGIIAMIWILLFIFASHSLRLELFGENWQWSLYIRIFVPISLIGLIIGVLGFKRANKILSAIGIILCSIALIFWLFIWFWVTGWSIA